MVARFWGCEVPALRGCKSPRSQGSTISFLHGSSSRVRGFKVGLTGSGFPKLENFKVESLEFKAAGFQCFKVPVLRGCKVPGVQGRFHASRIPALQGSRIPRLHA